LWNEYLDLIKRGAPVYFNFTRDMVEYILNKNEIKFEDACELINKLASKYYLVDGETAFLCDEAFIQGDSGFSPVILLICQQVMVVEEMVKCESFSENAYFPRLRTFMSKDLGEISQNPFYYDDFENIWKMLAREIYSISQNKSCITFNFQAVKGASKAKRFPLGQALFTKEDIVRLIDAIGRIRVQKERVDTVLSLINANKKCLKRRGKYLITLPWVQNSLVEQLKAFANSDDNLEFIRKEVEESKIKSKGLYPKIYLDNQDWLSMEYVINIFDENDDLVQDFGLVKQALESEIGNVDYKVLTPTPMGDCWRVDNGKYFPLVGDTIFVLFKSGKDNNAKLIIDRFFNSENEITPLCFHRVDKVEYFKVKITNSTKVNAYISKGFFVESTSNSLDHEKALFVGGIPVNKSQNRYSSIFLPNAIIINNTKYELEGKITVNSFVSTFENLKEEVKSISINQDYNITLESGKSFILKVAPRSKTIGRKIDYAIKDGRSFPISTICENVKDSQDYIDSDSSEIFKILRELKQKGNLQQVSRILRRRQSSCDI
jgi:hypothetical protein